MPQPAAVLLKTLLRPYRRQLVLPIFLAAISVVLFIVQSALLARIFADWLSAASQQQPLTRQLLQHDLPALLLCLFLRPLTHLIKDYVLQNVSLRCRQQLRVQLLDKIAAFGAARQQFGNDGALSMQILEQVDALDGYISRYYVQSKLAMMTPLIIAAAVFFHSPLAAGLMLLTAPLVPIFMILVGSLAADKSRQQLRVLNQLGGQFLDIVRGLPTLRRLAATNWAQTTIARSAEEYRQKTMSVLRLAFLSGAILELFSALAIALVAVYLGLGLIGILPWAAGRVPVPYQSALFILLLAPEFYLPLRQLGSDYHAKAQAQAAISMLQPLLAANPPPQLSSSKPLTAAPSLRFAQLTMIDAVGRKRLAPVSFTVAAGERVGICGKSGVGKSSLLHALLGFADYQGVININGESAQFWRRQDIAYLAQTPTLLSGTIAENLRLAQKEASASDMKRVLMQVDLWTLISALPLGLDTPLGENGRGLSGGQQQRLSLAQLLLSNKPLWLLDEPAAHLDEQTAAEIYAILACVSTGKTLLLVGHDIEHLPWLDHIITLKESDEASAAFA